MKKNHRIKLIAIVGSLLTGLRSGGCDRQKAQSPPPSAEVFIVTLKLQRVMLTTELPGRTSAYLIAEVRPQVGGIIQKRLFTEGSDVKEGEVLYQLESAVYQETYNSAKAALAKAEANLIPIRLKAGRYAGLVKINAVTQQDSE